jgi:FkbM family methyltransferase
MNGIFTEGSILSDGSYGPFEGSIDDDVVHGHYRREGSWAPELLELLVDGLFPAGRGTFLDVGANIGLVSIPLVERRGVRCLAFEPEPRNYRWLERNIARHGLEALFQTFDVALHSENETLCFDLSATNFGDHRLRGEVDPETDSTRASIFVPGRRLDDLVCLEELPRPIRGAGAAWGVALPTSDRSSHLRVLALRLASHGRQRGDAQRDPEGVSVWSRAFRGGRSAPADDYAGASPGALVDSD